MRRGGRCRLADERYALDAATQLLDDPAWTFTSA
jgi:hypothetical protein